MDPGLEHCSDEELARQAQAGSFSAYEELVYRHEGRVYRFLCQSCRNETDARELTQDTFVAAFNAVARFNPNRSFATWLFTIARRKFIDHWRARRPDPTETLPEQEDPEHPASILQARETAAAIWDFARRLLPEIQFQALWLRCQEEMEIKEIAHSLRLSRVHVKVLLFRARQKLILALDRSPDRPSAAAGRSAPEVVDAKKRALSAGCEILSVTKPEPGGT